MSQWSPSQTRSWDPLSNLKGRIGEAFVENILVAAGYTVCRGGRESQVPRLFKTGEGEFLPDFFVWKRAGTSSDVAPLHHLLCVEVKFRSNPRDLFQSGELDRLLQAAACWPELHVVLVTNHPEPGRSCFQLLDLRGSDPDTPLTTRDLHEVYALGIEKTITDEYEDLVRQVFSTMSSSLPEDHPRKPLAKLTTESSPSVKTPLRSGSGPTS